MARTSYCEFREMSIENDAEPTLIHKRLRSHFYGSLQRKAVRTDASKDRTLSHTVPLRGGTMQRDACAYFCDGARGDTAVFQISEIIYIYT